MVKLSLTRTATPKNRFLVCGQAGLAINKLSFKMLRFTAQRSESCIGAMANFLAPFAAWAAQLGSGTAPLNMAGVVKGAVGAAIQASGSALSPEMGVFSPPSPFFKSV